MLGACLGGTIALYASDLVGVYGVVEKVVLEPSDASPERAQIWGAFAVYKEADGSTYQSPQRGYLYYSCPQGKESVCRTGTTLNRRASCSGTAVMSLASGLARSAT